MGYVFIFINCRGGGNVMMGRIFAKVIRFPVTYGIGEFDGADMGFDSIGICGSRRRQIETAVRVGEIASRCSPRRGSIRLSASPVVNSLWKSVPRCCRCR